PGGARKAAGLVGIVGRSSVGLIGADELPGLQGELWRAETERDGAVAPRGGQIEKGTQGRHGENGKRIRPGAACWTIGASRGPRARLGRWLSYPRAERTGRNVHASVRHDGRTITIGARDD